jgi:hypothetical protein
MGIFTWVAAEFISWLGGPVIWFFAQPIISVWALLPNVP